MEKDKSIRTVIIDDEQTARFVLRNKLEEYFSDTVHIAGEADDIASGLALIHETNPQLLFLDIRLRNGTGFELLNQLENINFEVVFVTAYDNFAIQAFEFSATGYLLKPVKIDDLRKTIGRVGVHIQKQDNHDTRIRVLIDNYNSAQGQIKRMVISSMAGFEVVNMDEIIRLEAERNYTHFILTDGRKMTVSKTIGNYEPLLAEHGFYRVHQSHIINLRHVRSYLKAEGGKVKMSDGEIIYISRQRKNGFTELFIG
ncbi:MAG TPA: LytTR family DNA-binding domain-containing protein [Flavobacteriales bacterium]|nr:LytTR family DNA-binding domain-containing protein [Flavobacteriales bacterium]